MAKMGRPSKYKPEFVEQARKLYVIGATDEQVCNFFGIDVATFHRWKNKYADFCEASRSGKENHDSAVETAFLRRVLGYRYKEKIVKRTGVKKDEKGNYTGGVVTYIEHEKEIPPDPYAATFWLRNRQTGKWKANPEDAPSPLSPKDIPSVKGKDPVDAAKVYQDTMRK